MHINVVTVRSGWILQKIAERIVEAGNNQRFHTRRKNDGTIKSEIGWRLSHVPRMDCAANYYVDIQNCFGGKSPVLDVGYFTHLHENSVHHVQPHWLKADFIVHGCTKYYDIFKDFYPEERMAVLIPGEIPDGFYMKKPVIGIFQRGKYEGKGFHFMQKMAEDYQWVMNHFSWRFVGNDWEPVIKQFNDLGIEAYSRGDAGLSYPDGYAAEYDKVDYVLIPSLWEGGPMSLIEANAKGIPIISSNVGQASVDIGIDHFYNTGSTRELANILHTILAPMVQRRDRVAHLSYEYYTRKLAKIICGLRGEEHDIP